MPRKASRKKRRNPGELEAAAALSEQFHGRPARKVEDVLELRQEREALAKLGRLLGFSIWVDEDDCRVLGWVDNDQAPTEAMRGVSVAASPDGGQLYFVGGDQKLDLVKLGLAGGLPKDYVAIGPVQTIAYHTSKDFHDFEPVNYVHDFGEENGEMPILIYDTLNNRFALAGGSYKVERPGIVN